MICDGRKKLKSYDFADVELFSVLRAATAALSSVLVSSDYFFKHMLFSLS